MDCNEVVALIIMDLSKAFDCLRHDLMAAKLIAYGMSHSAVNILISYLRDRKQCVKIGSDTSDCMTILKGIPQGSILGPSLFNLFFNDFMYILKHTSVVNYADDNTLGSRGDTLWKALKDAKTDTKSAIRWYKNTQMQANAIKFHYMHISKGTDTDFQCEGININQKIW